MKDNLVLLEVIDDGVGITEDRLAEIRSGTVKSIFGGGQGIANVNTRIRLSSGQEFGLRMESEYTKGTKVTIVQPLRTPYDTRRG
ncbi:Histidine kinase-, DNA gyrase B-, and HSP90-like ATPase [compost metagenome]